METESLALEAFQRHPDFHLHRTVSVLVDVLFIKHLFIPCGIEPCSSQALAIQDRLVVEFHRDYRRKTHNEGQSDSRTYEQSGERSNRPEAYLTRMLQYEALYLPDSHHATVCLESDSDPAGSLSSLLDSALGVLATDPAE